MKKTIILLFLAAMSLGASGQKVKTAVYWTSSRMYRGDADSLARFDLVIVDLENMVNNYDSLLKMKRINPGIKLIAYSNPMEIFEPRMDWRPLQNAWSEELYSKYSGWFLKTGKGKKAIFWKGMIMLNLSSSCPKINDLTYGEWMADFLIKNVFSDKIWDGYFMDNSGGNISWVYSGKKEQIDIDADGQADADTIIDLNWSEGIEHFLKKIRDAKGPEFIMIGNKGSVEFEKILDGKMFEEWPNDYLGDKRDGGWYQCMANASKTGPYTIFQANAQNLKFAVASALLLDNIYVAVEQNNRFFYPEFRINLGRADIPISRKFENGIIEVNPSQREGEIFIKKD